MGDANSKLQKKHSERERNNIFLEDCYDGMRPTKIFNHFATQIREQVYKSSYIPYEGEIREQMAIYYPDTRQQIQQTPRYPFSSVGLVFAMRGSERGFGTGCLIKKNIVLTCAHNCYSRDSEQQFQKISFVPALNGNDGKQVQVIKICYPDQYKTEEIPKNSEYDYALLLLKKNIGDDYGFLGLDARTDNVGPTTEITIAGYPQSKNKTMWKAIGKPESKNQTFIRYKISTDRGQSGSPIFKKEGDNYYVVGIHIGDGGAENVGVPLTRQKRMRLKSWVGQMTGILDLRSMNINDEDIEEIKSKIKLKKVKNLYLSRNNLEDKDLLKIMGISWMNLLVLDLSSNKIVLDNVKHSDLKAFSSLVELNLSSNQIGKKGARLLTEINFTNLQKLSLNQTHLPNQGIHFLSQLLPNLQALHFDGNQINDEKLIFLTQKSGLCLRELSLKNNEIEDKGVSYLTKFPNLQTLSLEGNKVKGENVAWPKNIKKLNLKKNLLGTDLSSLSRCSKLESLNLQMNKIGLKGAEEFEGEKFPSLKKLEIDLDFMGKKGMKILKKFVNEKNIHGVLWQTINLI